MRQMHSPPNQSADYTHTLPRQASRSIPSAIVRPFQMTTRALNKIGCTGSSPLLFSHIFHDGQIRREQERIAALIAGRQQREAKLVGEFDSDEIYDPEDEQVLSMRQAQQESRRRIRDLCEGRKFANCTTLVTDDLIRELETFLTRYGLLGVSVHYNTAPATGGTGP